MAGAITVSTSPMNLKDTTMEEQHISLELKGSSLPTIAPVQSERSPVIVHKGTGIGLFGYEGSPNGMVNGMSSMDPKVSIYDMFVNMYMHKPYQCTITHVHKHMNICIHTSDVPIRDFSDVIQMIA